MTWILYIMAFSRRLSFTVILFMKVNLFFFLLFFFLPQLNQAGLEPFFVPFVLWVKIFLLRSCSRFATRRSKLIKRILIKLNVMKPIIFPLLLPPHSRFFRFLNFSLRLPELSLMLMNFSCSQILVPQAIRIFFFFRHTCVHHRICAKEKAPKMICAAPNVNLIS